MLCVRLSLLIKGDKFTERKRVYMDTQSINFIGNICGKFPKQTHLKMAYANLEIKHWHIVSNFVFCFYGIFYTGKIIKIGNFTSARPFEEMDSSGSGSFSERLSNGHIEPRFFKNFRDNA